MLPCVNLNPGGGCCRPFIGTIYCRQPVVLLAAADALDSLFACCRNRENNIDLFAAIAATEPSRLCLSPGGHVRFGLYLSCHMTASFQTSRPDCANISIRTV